MQHIQTVTVGSGGAASITFSTIPATFTDLVILCSLRSNRAGDAAGDQFIRFNGSSSGYFFRLLFGNGSFPTTFGSTGSEIFGMLSAASAATANTFSNSSIYISNYTSNAAKSVSIDMVTENNATVAHQRIISALWNQTEVINSVVIFDGNSSLLIQGSSASLYGITAGSSGGVVVS